MGRVPGPARSPWVDRAVPSTSCVGGRRRAPRRRRRRPVGSPSIRSGNTAPGSSRPSPSASLRSRTAKSRPGCEPAVGLERVLGIDREARGQHEAARLGDRPQTVERRPRALGVDVVGRDRRDAAPVVDAGVEQHAEVVGQVGRGLEVDVRGQDQAGQGDGLEVVVGRARRRPVHGRAGLGQEVLDDDLLDVAVASMRRRRSPRARRSGRRAVSPMPTRIPVVKGIASSPAASRVARRRAGSLSGEPRAHRDRPASRSSFPGTARPDRSSRSSSAIQGSGVGVGQQAGLVQDQGGHGGEVVDGGRVAVPRRSHCRAWG